MWPTLSMPLLAEARPFNLNPPFSTVRVFEPNFKLPLTIQWNMAIEQSLGPSRSLSVSYVGAAGRRLLRSEGILNPNPDFQQVFIVTNDATSDYHALQLQFQQRLAKHFQALAAYTWSHSIDINSNDSFSNIPSVKVDPSLDRGPSDFDVRHSFGAAVTFDIPTTTLSGLGSTVFRNWALDTMLIARTATPVDIFNGRDIGFGVFNFRPDRIEGVPLYLTDPSAPGGKVINRAAFAIPVDSRQGTLGRNALRGFPVSQINFALRRRFKVNEKIKSPAPSRNFQSLQSSDLRRSRRRPCQWSVRTLNFNSRQKFGKRRKWWRAQPTLPARRSALYAVRGEATILRNVKLRLSIRTPNPEKLALD